MNNKLLACYSVDERSLNIQSITFERVNATKKNNSQKSYIEVPASNYRKTLLTSVEAQDDRGL